MYTWRAGRSGKVDKAATGGFTVFVYAKKGGTTYYGAISGYRTTKAK